MMEYALCLLIGLVAGMWLEKLYNGKRKAPDMSDSDKRLMEKAMREYRNFMDYDGFPKEE